MTTLNGKVALVTGGSRGIGRAIATRFLEAGCTVHVAARDGAMLQAFAGSLHVGGDRIVTHVADLSTPAGVADLAARCGDSDILINNAGAIPAGTIESIDDETWVEAWNLKVFGYARLIRRIIPGMYARGSGVILNIIGMAGVANDYNYVCGSAGNAALIALTHAIGARSPDRGVRVLGINPAGTSTERIERLMRVQAKQKLGNAERWQELLTDLPFGRLLAPEEIANLALFLVSDQASYLSGTVVNCDGGGLYR
jgi:NAD(P)-dependent dehydrogenase (short-subunit alcohol dehydrogenase family)